MSDSDAITGLLHMLVSVSWGVAVDDVDSQAVTASPGLVLMLQVSVLVLSSVLSTVVVEGRIESVMVLPSSEGVEIGSVDVGVISETEINSLVEPIVEPSSVVVTDVVEE